jgi:hypothetical protein
LEPDASFEFLPEVALEPEASFVFLPAVALVPPVGEFRFD